MMGSASDPGVIPKVVGAIFAKCAALPGGVTVTVRASYLQIYREVLQDLSSTRMPPDDLKIRRDPKLGTYVQVAGGKYSHGTYSHSKYRRDP